MQVGEQVSSERVTVPPYLRRYLQVQSLCFKLLEEMLERLMEKLPQDLLPAPKIQETVDAAICGSLEIGHRRFAGWGLG